MSEQSRTDKAGRSSPLLGVAAILALLFWLLESLLHGTVFASRNADGYLWPRDVNELWMRLLIVGLLLGFGYTADRLLRGRQAADRTTYAILESTTDAYVAVDREWCLTYLNARAERLFETRRDDVLGSNVWDAFPEAASTFYKPLRQSMAARRDEVFEGFYSAGRVWMEVHTYPSEGGMAFFLRDITEQRERERSLRDSNKRLQTILDSAGDGILSINSRGRVETINKAAERIFGYRADEVLGHNVTMLMPEPDASRHDSYITNYLRTAHSKIIDVGPREVVALRKDGSQFPMDLAVSEMQLDDARYFVGIVRDITERKRAQEALEYMSNYDPLTDLPNRSLLQDRLEHALKQARRDEHLVAVMFLDLDRFKNINDTLGHAVGDELLKAVSKRILGCLRDCDTLARLGGDEFVVVLEDIEHVDNAALVATKILDAFAEPVTLQGHEVIVSGSIGITIYPFDDDNVDDLLRDADTAMYRAKEAGRNTYQYFTADMTDHAVAHLNLEQDLRRALEREEFELFYQPQIDLASGSVIGVEALLRWRHPRKDLVSPGVFIPILEETGMILPVGEWVLREACRQGKVWSDAGLPLRVAVNMSGRQFYQANLTDRIRTVLRETGMEPRRLELEITESLLVENVSATVDMLSELDAMGLRLSIDDFGTGYSSLAYLKRFPLHTLKIDQSFVRDVIEDADSAAIAQAIIALARSLRLGVIAEGVETDAQVAFLERNGCEEVQGFLFCRPLPAAELTAWLRDNADRRLA